MRAKPNLVPDCDVHGEPMFRDEYPASALGLEGRRDIIIWRCTREGCGRYFYGTVGYRDCPDIARTRTTTVRCREDGAYLVVQRARGSYICPVAGCTSIEPWQVPARPLTTTPTPAELAEEAPLLTSRSG